MKVIAVLYSMKKDYLKNNDLQNICKQFFKEILYFVFIIDWSILQMHIQNN